jgi:NAD(P)-dependent dehydrogenase (short-subunit alcohol dehydrogenase family)
LNIIFLLEEMQFQNKIVIITGATGGMGRALCWRFGRAGAKIGVLDLRREDVENFAKDLDQAGIYALDLPCDVTDEQACRTAIQKVAEKFGGVDVLINNAGITHRSAFEKTKMQTFRKVLEVNFFGALHCTQSALSYLQQNRGMIIVMSSIAGFSPLIGRSGYSASKHALHGMFESLRTELRDKGVQVMMVCPGFTATNIEKNALDGDGRPTTHPRSTTGKIATSEEVAEAIYRAAMKNKRLLVLSTVGKLAYLMSRFFPAYYERMMTKRLRQELER